jgi:hypothetical protein
MESWDQALFTKRTAGIRARFASQLAGKISATSAALPCLGGDGSDAIDAVALAYRRFHDVCGMGSTIGFQATGRSARSLEGILIGAFRDHRGLSTEELAGLKQGLESLRIAAQTEMQSTDSDRE